MRLIHCATRTLKEFNAEAVPPYAILSHVWHRDGELSFQDFSNKPSSELIAQQPASYQKILSFCIAVLEYALSGDVPKEWNLEYAWVDTVCIDKTSSAELSEAINSMYRWYRDARVCFTYMVDVHQSPQLGPSVDAQSEFARSRYWTRGWTLQELLAPRGPFRFYKSDWTFLGERSALTDAISQVTRIPREILRSPTNINNYSIAQRFSWAANRQTTREEDMAYSLLGLFNINMPLLYGEGSKAFVRLQEEILKESSDQTIFAWQDEDSLDGTALTLREQLDVCGVLATHPRSFRHSSGMQPKPMGFTDRLKVREIASTNLGLRLDLPLHNYGHYLVAELAVIARSPSSVTTTRPYASWGLPNNHVCIILWPEPGDKGRLMRVRTTPCTLRTQLNEELVDSLHDHVHLLKTNWALRHYVRRPLEVSLKGISEHRLTITSCSYAPFPVTPLTLFQAMGNNRRWDFWEPDLGGETVILLKLLVREGFSRTSKTQDPVPVRHEYTVVLWLHPVIAPQCALVQDQLDSENTYQSIMKTLHNGLEPKAAIEVPRVGVLHFRGEVTRRAYGQRAYLEIELEQPKDEKIARLLSESGFL